MVVWNIGVTGVKEKIEADRNGKFRKIISILKDIPIDEITIKWINYFEQEHEGDPVSYQVRYTMKGDDYMVTLKDEPCI